MERTADDSWAGKRWKLPPPALSQHAQMAA